MLKMKDLLIETKISNQNKEIIDHFKAGGTYDNGFTYQYFIQPKGDVEKGSYFKYDFQSGKYTKFPTLEMFLRAIRKSLKRG